MGDTGYADEAERRDSIALAVVRQLLAHEGQPLAPVWEELTGHERDMAALDARNYLRAARRAGFVVTGPDFDPEDDPAAADEELVLLQRELQLLTADVVRLESVHGEEQLALRYALGIEAGEPWSMTRLIRRVRQVVGELAESHRKAARSSGRARDLAGQLKSLSGQLRHDDPPRLADQAVWALRHRRG